MKKQTALFLSFTAILTISAFAPHISWHADKAARVPASIEEDRLEDLARENEVPNLLELEVVEVKSQEVKLVEVEAQILCLKEAQPRDLEAEISKLIDDKESILKELAELKKEKKNLDKKINESEEDKVDNKEKTKIVKSESNQDILNIMSQLTSLMISQQQQQMSMMTQMFSMFQTQMPKQTSINHSLMSDYVSPYAFNASSFELPKNESIYSLSAPKNNIGLGLSARGANGVQNELYSTRIPAQFDRSPIESESFQLKFQTPREMIPHDGFDFSQGLDALSMRRVQF